MPMALLLMKPEYDIWSPGDHTGTFRGNNIAFVAAEAALQFWGLEDFREGISDRTKYIDERLSRICSYAEEKISKKGIGMMRGLAFGSTDVAALVARNAVRNRVLLETCGPTDEVVKIMPALNIPWTLLTEALNRLELAVQQTMTNLERCDANRAA